MDEGKDVGEGVGASVQLAGDGETFYVTVAVKVPKLDIGDSARKMLRDGTEAPAWAESEARLEKAKADGVIACVQTWWPSALDAPHFSYWLYREIPSAPTMFSDSDRATAAALAADVADSWRKPKLLDVDGMDFGRRNGEMVTRGWFQCLAGSGRCVWTHAKHPHIDQGNDETPRNFSIRALTEARHRDRDA